MSYTPTIDSIRNGDLKAIARGLSIIENGTNGHEALLEQFSTDVHAPVVGFTGPPGAGKSSLVNALAGLWAKNGLKVAVLAVDPSSPFNFGSILGDRLRMAGLFTSENVFIRSVSSRGSLGGLSASIIEMVELLKNAGFDRIIIETVGVGQSEVEIAGVADTTVVVTVPESGDEVQTLKSGVMEIADIFVVNKSDRDGADQFAKYLIELVHSRLAAKEAWKTPVIKTVAIDSSGVKELNEAIVKHAESAKTSNRKHLLMAEKVEALVARKRMADFDLHKVADELKVEMQKPGFNLYKYSKKFFQP